MNNLGLIQAPEIEVLLILTVLSNRYNNTIMILFSADLLAGPAMSRFASR